MLVQSAEVRTFTSSPFAKYRSQTPTCSLNSTAAARAHACVHIVSVFVCIASVIAFQEARNCLFKCSEMVKQTHGKTKTQMQTQAKNIP